MAVDMAISATEKPLGKVFTSDYQLTIPSFQRAYTWQAENIEQLVNDLQDACADPDTPYFLGSLILVKDGPTQYQVIDGQQRLISLSIIVSVLRELEDDPDLIDSLNDLILEPGDKLRGIKAEPRLTLRERDTDFFRMYVQEGDLEGLFDLRDNDIASHAQRNIAVNTRRTFDLLAAMDAKDRLIPGQRRHPRHRHHRRPRRRAPHLRRDEHARRATDRIRRVQSETHRGNIPRRA